jgi:hypothetical protein
MDKNGARKILGEIEEQFLAKDSSLCWTIARELADFTVVTSWRMTSSDSTGARG